MKKNLLISDDESSTDSSSSSWSVETTSEETSSSSEQSEEGVEDGPSLLLSRHLLEPELALTEQRSLLESCLEHNVEDGFTLWREDVQPQYQSAREGIRAVVEGKGNDVVARKEEDYFAMKREEVEVEEEKSKKRKRNALESILLHHPKVHRSYEEYLQEVRKEFSLRRNDEQEAVEGERKLKSSSVVEHPSSLSLEDLVKICCQLLLKGKEEHAIQIDVVTAAPLIVSPTTLTTTTEVPEEEVELPSRSAKRKRLETNAEDDSIIQTKELEEENEKNEKKTSVADNDDDLPNLTPTNVTDVPLSALCHFLKKLRHILQKLKSELIEDMELFASPKEYFFTTPQERHHPKELQVLEKQIRKGKKKKKAQKKEKSKEEKEGKENGNQQKEEGEEKENAGGGVVKKLPKSVDAKEMRAAYLYREAIRKKKHRLDTHAPLGSSVEVVEIEENLHDLHEKGAEFYVSLAHQQDTIRALLLAAKDEMRVYQQMLKVAPVVDEARWAQLSQLKSHVNLQEELAQRCLSWEKHLKRCIRKKERKKNNTIEKEFGEEVQLESA